MPWTGFEDWRRARCVCAGSNGISQRDVEIARAYIFLRIFI